MTNKLFDLNKNIFFYNFLNKNLSIFKYIYIKKKQYLKFFPFFNKYSFNNIFFINLIPVILIFRLITPILFKFIFQYKNLLMIDNDSKLKIILIKICKSLNIAYGTKWNLGTLINWNFFNSKKNNFIKNNKLLYFPELIITLNSNKNNLLLHESFKMNVHTISIASNLNLFKLISYPILGNCENTNYSKTILLLFYYIIIFSYIYRIKHRFFFLKRKKNKKVLQQKIFFKNKKNRISSLMVKQIAHNDLI